MGNIKRKHTTSFKIKVALELLRDKEPVSVICSRYSIHPNQARQWKDKALSAMAGGLSSQPRGEQKQKDKLIEELYTQVGRQKMELEWLKKNMEAA